MDKRSGMAPAAVAIFCCVFALGLAYVATVPFGSPGHLRGAGPDGASALVAVVTAPFAPIVLLMLYSVAYTINIRFLVRSCLTGEAAQKARRRLVATAILHWVIAGLVFALVAFVLGSGLAVAVTPASGLQSGPGGGDLGRGMESLLKLGLMVVVIALVIDYIASGWSLLRSNEDHPGLRPVAYLAVAQGILIAVFPFLFGEVLFPETSLWPIAIVASAFNLSVARAVLKSRNATAAAEAEQGTPYGESL